MIDNTRELFDKLYDDIRELGDTEDYYAFDLAPCDGFYDDETHEGLPFTDQEKKSNLTCMELAEQYISDQNYNRAIDMVRMQAIECMNLGDFGVYDELMAFVGWKLKPLTSDTTNAGV